MNRELDADSSGGRARKQAQKALTGFGGESLPVSGKEDGELDEVFEEEMRAIEEHKELLVSALHVSDMVAVMAQ